MAVCEHLRPLESALLAAGMEETFRGQAWSTNCREWVYFRCVLNRRSLRDRFALPACVIDHEHLGTHDGMEAGFVWRGCNDGIMGSHPKHPSGPEYS